MRGGGKGEEGRKNKKIRNQFNSVQFNV